jgi:hypothetical protein
MNNYVLTIQCRWKLGKWSSKSRTSQIEIGLVTRWRSSWAVQECSCGWSAPPCGCTSEWPRIIGRCMPSRCTIILRLSARENIVLYQHRSSRVWWKCIAQRKINWITGSGALVWHLSSRNSNKKAGNLSTFSLGGHGIGTSSYGSIAKCSWCIVL